MRLSAKPLIATVVFIAVLALGVATAVGVQALTVTTRPSVITYPRASQVLVNLEGFASAPATITMQYRRVDGGAWTNWKGKLILPKRSANTTSAHFTAGPPWLNQTTEFRAVVNGGVSSNVATVTVKARLSKPTARIWRTGRVFDSNVTFTGLIWPHHEKGKPTVTLTFSKWVGGAWVPQPGLTVKAPISRWRYWLPWAGHQRDYASKWAIPVPLASLKGTGKTQWRVQASHEDTSHALSQSDTTTFWVR